MSAGTIDGKYGTVGPVVTRSMESESVFLDRREAGRALACCLAGYEGLPGVVVLGLPLGGVPVAFEIARALCAPLDIMIVRTLGVPGREELAMGAIASGDVQVLDEEMLLRLGLTQEIVASVAAEERAELSRCECVYRGTRAAVAVEGKTVILVDDGLTTGSTMRAAIGALRRRKPARIVAAVPIAPEEICEELRGEVDHMVCARTPSPFYGVGRWYRSYSQTSDEEVRGLVEWKAPALN